MPRVALTENQRRKNAAKALYHEILGELNAKRGRENKTHQDFAQELGISPRTWKRWNDGGMGKSEFGTVLDAAMKAGVRLTVEPKEGVKQ